MAYFTTWWLTATLLMAEEVPQPFSQEKWEGSMACLTSARRAERDAATQQLALIAKQFPLIAKKHLLASYEQHAEPEVRERCRMLLKTMAAEDYHRLGEGYLGVSMGQEWQGLLPGDLEKCFGMVITAISDSSPAAHAKLQVGDIIVGLGDQRWREPQKILDPQLGLSASIRAMGAGKSVGFGILRGKELMNCEVTLTRRPKQIDQWRPQIQPNGQLKLDQVELKKLIDEEKDSVEFFQEWLQHAKKEVAEP